MRTFILAAGKAERHNGGNKPLLMVCGMTLLERTWALAEPHSFRLTLVTDRSDLVPPTGLNSSKLIPALSRWTIETLASTQCRWSVEHPTVILLGDVYYTEAAIFQVFSTELTCAFGSGFNIHAVKIMPKQFALVSKTLRNSIDSAVAHPTQHGAGKLWLWLKCNPDIPVIDFGDETTDFDSPQEHKRFVEKYGNRSTSTPSETH